jgi:hypothetical protein
MFLHHSPKEEISPFVVISIQKHGQVNLEDPGSSPIQPAGIFRKQPMSPLKSAVETLGGREWPLSR